MSLHNLNKHMHHRQCYGLSVAFDTATGVETYLLRVVIYVVLDAPLLSAAMENMEMVLQTFIVSMSWRGGKLWKAAQILSNFNFTVQNYLTSYVSGEYTQVNC